MKTILKSGFKIRNTEEIEFGGLVDHATLPIVPEGVYWLDDIYKDEYKDLFHTRKTMDFLMESKGLTYEKAKDSIRKSCRKQFPDSDITQCFVGQIGEVAEGRVMLGNGAKIRREFDPSYKYGGHWKVYDYIPEGIIIIDDKVLRQERKYILRHEHLELQLMLRGMDYNSAHDFANAAEKTLRRQCGVAHYIKD